MGTIYDHRTLKPLLATLYSYINFNMETNNTFLPKSYIINTRHTVQHRKYTHDIYTKGNNDVSFIRADILDL